MTMDEMLSIYKALSEPMRLRILKLLEDGEHCVCDLVAALDEVQPKISFHLSALKDAGLIEGRKAGKWNHYRLADGDIFRRFLITSTLERLKGSEMKSDAARMASFSASKKHSGCKKQK